MIASSFLNAFDCKAEISAKWASPVHQGHMIRPWVPLIGWSVSYRLLVYYRIKWSEGSDSLFTLQFPNEASKHIFVICSAKK